MTCHSACILCWVCYLDSLSRENSLNEKTDNRRVLIITAVIYCLMISYGLSFTMIGPLMPDILERFGLSMATGGTVVSIQNLSGLIAVVLVGFFGDRLNKNVFIALGILLFGLSLLGTGFAPSFGLLMISFFILGLGSRGFDTLVNAVMSDLHGERRSQFLNLLHTFFSVGAFLGPMFVYMVNRMGLSWRMTFVIDGVVVLLVFVAFLATLLRARQSGVGKLTVSENVGSSDTSAGNKLGIGFLFLRGRMWVLGLIMFIHMGVQGIVITWLPLFVGGSTGAGDFLSGFALSALWIAMERI